MSVTLDQTVPVWVYEKLEAFNTTKFTFDAEKHLYLHDDYAGNLISITTWLKDYTEPFDKPVRAAATARYTDRTVEEVIAEWDLNQLVGTQTHDFADRYFKYKGVGPIPVMDAHHDVQNRARKFLGLQAGRLKDYITVDSELRMFLLSLGLAGTLDWLAWHVPTQTLWIFDWKCTKRIDTDKTKCRRRMNGPFGDLWEHELNKYSIQLSWYRIMLAAVGLKTAGAVIVHLPGGLEKAECYQAINYCKRLREISGIAA